MCVTSVCRCCCLPLLLFSPPFPFPHRRAAPRRAAPIPSSSPSSPPPLKGTSRSPTCTRRVRRRCRRLYACTCTCFSLLPPAFFLRAALHLPAKAEERRQRPKAASRQPRRERRRQWPRKRARGEEETNETGGGGGGGEGWRGQKKTGWQEKECYTLKQRERERKADFLESSNDSLRRSAIDRTIKRRIREIQSRRAMGERERQNHCVITPLLSSSSFSTALCSTHHVYRAKSLSHLLPPFKQQSAPSSRSFLLPFSSLLLFRTFTLSLSLSLSLSAYERSSRSLLYLCVYYRFAGFLTRTHAPRMYVRTATRPRAVEPCD